MAETLSRVEFERIDNALQEGGNDAALAEIRKYVASIPPTHELEHFEFKRKPEKDKDLPPLWRKILCGFANVGGGTVVWGIDCREEDGVDAARGEFAIENPDAFRTTLENLRRSATEPPPPAVEYRVIVCDPNRKTGFVVCHIPEGSQKPYRVYDGVGQFFYRNGDNFKTIPTPMLRAMFYPQTSPSFRIECRYSWEERIPPGSPPGTKPNGTRFYMSLIFENERKGGASARSLFVVVWIGDGYEQRAKAQLAQPWHETGDSLGSTFDLKRTLHPGQRSRFGDLIWETNETEAPLRPCYVRFDVMSENHSPQYFGATLHFGYTNLAGNQFVRLDRLPDDAIP